MNARYPLSAFLILLLVVSMVCAESASVDPLTAEERAWLAEHNGTITLAHDPDDPPLDFHDDFGNHVGIAADYINLIQEKLGFSFHVLNMDSWDELLNAAENRKVDVICAARWTPERDKYLTFTEPYISIPTVIVMNKDYQETATLDDLHLKTLVVTEGYAVYEMLKVEYPWLDIKTSKSGVEGLLEISFNRRDAMIIGLGKASYLIEKNSIKNLRVAGYAEYMLDLSIASRNDVPILHSILEKGLALVSTAERQAIRKKWIAMSDLPPTLPWMRIVGIPAFLLVLIVFVIFWNVSLRRAVMQRARVYQESEKLLRESEQKFKMIFDFAPLGLLHFNRQGCITTCNDNFVQLVGSSRDLLIGLNILELPDQKMIAALKVTLGGGLGLYEGDYESATAVKTTPIRMLYSPILAPDGTVEGGIGIIEDVTNRVQAEEEKTKLESLLQQAQKMESIGTLAGGIAHDFNNLLFPIIGYSELLLERMEEGSSYRGSIKGIYTSALRARDLVKQILTFSRQANTEPRMMKMQPLIKEVLKLLRSSIPTSIEIKQLIDPKCGLIKGDPTQVHQIVMNLATNAFHAMEETGGVLEVALKTVEFKELDVFKPNMHPGSYACLSVSDTGTGMDKALIDKIFDPFFTTKDEGKGTGMGLAVVHGIVKGMCGHISVYSEVGKGTKFSLFIPLIKVDNDLHSVNVDPSIMGGSEHVLLVDDEEAILTIVQKMLEHLGYTVTAYSSSEEALEVFRADPKKFDVMMTDMTMPHLSGVNLSSALSILRPGFPVLLCTGFSENVTEEIRTSHGIRGFLLKPIIMRDLAQKMREVLGS